MRIRLQLFTWAFASLIITTRYRSNSELINFLAFLDQDDAPLAHSDLSLSAYGLFFRTVGRVVAYQYTINSRDPMHNRNMRRPVLVGTSKASMFKTLFAEKGAWLDQRWICHGPLRNTKSRFESQPALCPLMWLLLLLPYCVGVPEGLTFSRIFWLGNWRYTRGMLVWILQECGRVSLQGWRGSVAEGEQRYENNLSHWERHAGTRFGTKSVESFCPPWTLPDSVFGSSLMEQVGLMKICFPQLNRTKGMLRWETLSALSSRLITFPLLSNRKWNQSKQNRFQFSSRWVKLPLRKMNKRNQR